MPSTNPFLSVESFNLLGKETTRGTAATNLVSLPISPNPTLTPKPTYIPDPSLRGSAVQTYNDVLSVRHDEFDCKGFVFADTFPNLMMALLGGTDTVTGTVAPYSHSIPLLSDPAIGSQPASFTVVDVDQVVETTNAAKQMTGCQLESIDITASVTGALDWTAKWICNPFTEITVPTASFSTEVFIPAWSATITVGALTVKIEEMKITATRKTEPIFVLGNQSPFVNFAGPLEVTGSFTFLVEANPGVLTAGLTYEKQVVSAEFTDPQSSHSVTFQMSKVQFKDPKIDRSKTQVQATTNFEAEANTTDATGGGGGYSPLLFKATNAQQTAY